MLYIIILAALIVHHVSMCFAEETCIYVHVQFTVIQALELMCMICKCTHVNVHMYNYIHTCVYMHHVGMLKIGGLALTLGIA